MALELLVAVFITTLFLSLQSSGIIKWKWWILELPMFILMGLVVLIYFSLGTAWSMI